VQGTTGYDFLNQVNGLFIDAGTEKAFTGFYVSFTGEPADYHACLAEKKRSVLKTLLASELNRLTGLLASVATHDAAAKSFSRAEWQEALAEIIACFPVYRSYVTGTAAPGAEDIAVIKAAVHLACEYRKDLPPEVFAFIHALLVKPLPGAAAADFIARFQQLTGAVMAKGAEDTAFYCFHRFISENEVGGDPGRFGVGPADFYEFLRQQHKAWPQSQLASSTHDTKRSEDVRARLNVLSEIPDLWAQTVSRWSAMNGRHREGAFPDRNAEYVFYQTLAGAWPLSEERAQAYMEKAVHEAKQHTDWTKRNEAYESALKKFISGTLHDPEFISDLEQFIGRIAEAGFVNSLAQTLIKLTAPGVPDIYQGCELWDFSLVDPDNRRPVDFGARRDLLNAAGPLSAEEVWRGRDEGLPKLWLLQKTLKLRAGIADYANLNYAPVFARGIKADHVAAFLRGGKIMVLVPRLWLKLNHDWDDTVVELPGGGWYHGLTDEISSGEIRMQELFRKFPVALLIRKENH
jgi:(1->4)-alpha-D-glucan 1-alpha-D-glucosylmutase